MPVFLEDMFVVCVTNSLRLLIWLCWWCKRENSQVLLKEPVRSLPFSRMKEVRM